MKGMWAFVLALLLACLSSFGLGFLTGYKKSMEVPAKVSWIDKERPSCLWWSTADRRALCAWENIK